MKYETLKKNRQLIADSGNGVGYVHTLMAKSYQISSGEME